MTYTPTKEQIEKAARAMHADDVLEGRAGVDYDDMDEDARSWYIDNARTVLAVVGPVIASNTLEAYANGLENLQDLAGTPDFEWIVASMRLKAQNYLEEFDE